MFLAKSSAKICKIGKNIVPLQRFSKENACKDRDLAQLVAHTSGGREVAGSSPVIPTKKKTQITVNQRFGFLLFL